MSNFPISAGGKAHLAVRFFRGYHISRGNWVSILLDGSVPLEEVCRWLVESYLTTASRQKKQKMRPPKEWLVASNPNFYVKTTHLEITFSL
jgi:Uncharacterized protein conserved in bacteria